MVSETKLSAVLAEFAQTLTADLTIQGILNHVVEQIPDVLPVSAARLTIASPAYVASAGIAAAGTSALTFPLHQGSNGLGALDLFPQTSASLEPAHMAVAQTLADVTAAYLRNALARDDARAAAEQFRVRAHYDYLTGLPNRLLLQQRLDHVVARSARQPLPVAVLFVDLDDFKSVNDGYGHRAGDEMLVEVGRRLSELVRTGDTLARFSGDEFVFLCEDLRSEEDAHLLVQRVHSAFEQPFVVTGASVLMTASVGMAFAGRDEAVQPDLVFSADLAMYQAKRRADGHRPFIPRQRAALGGSHALEADLLHALHADGLELVYQPIVRSSDGMISGAEALLRWVHAEQGPINPLALVTIAERGGFAADLGAWVLERSCRDWQRWRDRHPDGHVQLAVNVSGQQLMAPYFSAAVAAVLDRAAMPADALTLEITTSALAANSVRTAMVLNDLKSLQVQIALDDFGTGFSSLDYLSRFPLDVVKIDREVVAAIEAAPASAAVVAAVTGLAHTFGLTVTAEGVETRRQRDEVRAIGFDHAQGMFYSPPVSATMFLRQLVSAPRRISRAPSIA